MHKGSKRLSYQSIHPVASAKGPVLGLLCLALLIFWGSSASAEEIKTFATIPNATAVEKATSTLQIKLSSRSAINLAALLQRVEDADTIESAYDKIDALRKKLYPKAEIVVEIGKAGGVAPLDCWYVDLVRKIVWFNSTHAYGTSWIAANIDSAAAVCVVKVNSGRYNHYYQRTDGTWASAGTTYAGGLWTASTYGSYFYRGFKGRAVSSVATNKADIVMYFYE